MRRLEQRFDQMNIHVPPSTWSHLNGNQHTHPHTHTHRQTVCLSGCFFPMIVSILSLRYRCPSPWKEVDAGYEFTASHHRVIKRHLVANRHTHTHTHTHTFLRVFFSFFLGLWRRRRIRRRRRRRRRRKRRRRRRREASRVGWSMRFRSILRGEPVATATPPTYVDIFHARVSPRDAEKKIKHYSQ